MGLHNVTYFIIMTQKNTPSSTLLCVKPVSSDLSHLLSFYHTSCSPPGRLPAGSPSSSGLSRRPNPCGSSGGGV